MTFHLGNSRCVTRCGHFENENDRNNFSTDDNKVKQNDEKSNFSYRIVSFSSSSYIDIDRPSLAAAALYDLKNEQLQLANAALQQQQQQQQTTVDRHSIEMKSQDGDSTATQYAEGEDILSFSIEC